MIAVDYGPGFDERAAQAVAALELNTSAAGDDHAAADHAAREGRIASGRVAVSVDIDRVAGRVVPADVMTVLTGTPTGFGPPPARRPVVGSAAPCGRNARCPCGSGKKFKTCCRKEHP